MTTTKRAWHVDSESTTQFGALREPNWVALSNLANRRRFDAGLSIDKIAAESGLARSTVVVLLTGETGAGRLASWFKLAQGLGIDWLDLAAALNDPDFDQPNILDENTRETRPSLPTVIRQITSIMPPDKAERMSVAELHTLVTGMGYDTSQDAVRLAKWRIDTANRKATQTA